MFNFQITPTSVHSPVCFIQGSQDSGQVLPLLLDTGTQCARGALFYFRGGTPNTFLSFYPLAVPRSMFDWVIEPVGEGEFTVEDDVKHVGQASATNTKFCTAPKDPFAGSMLVSGRIDPKPLFGEALDCFCLEGAMRPTTNSL